jgi:two-component system, cell cycle sensor histidine kinase and response regulator CckA
MKSQPDSSAPRVIVIDDSKSIHEDIRRILGHRPAGDNSGEESPFRIDSAFQGEEALGLVEQAQQAQDPYALAFIDVRMPPGWDGVETLERLWRIYPDLQAVICTAYADYSWRDLRRRLGQTDNLLILKKPFEAIEVQQIAHTLTRKWSLGQEARRHVADLDRMVAERTEKLRQEASARTRAQDALHISEERFSKAFEVNPMPMAIQSWPERRFLAANPSFLELTGYAPEQLLQQTETELHLLNSEAELREVPGGSRARNHRCTLRRGDNSTRTVMLWTEPITLDSQACRLLVMEDVTEQQKLEAQLRQAQKLEIVGRLVASVSHEFNNVLTVIQGHATLLHYRLTEANVPTESVERILQASQRAASFTNHLLAFSRKQTVTFKSINLLENIPALRKMIGQLLGEHFEIKVDLSEGLPLVRANDGGVEQIIINLALNARDAMPNGGVIALGASVAVVAESEAGRHAEARPGRFVCLSVSDSGCGIPREMISRIFDPFFTTKEVGKGTGLGLSMVHSIVQQHHGWIEVDSEIGHGSTFKVFFPVLEGAVAPDKTVSVVVEPAEERGSGETVLVVEDDQTVREMARATLEQGGYRVLEAADGRVALSVWDKSPVIINLVVTDIVMPNGISGGALARTLQSRTPGLHVICTSGYNPEFIKKDLPATRGITFLPKPYDPHQLLKAVRQCLDGGKDKAKKTRGPGSHPVAAP